MERFKLIKCEEAEGGINFILKRFVSNRDMSPEFKKDVLKYFDDSDKFNKTPDGKYHLDVFVNFDDEKNVFSLTKEATHINPNE